MYRKHQVDLVLCDEYVHHAALEDSVALAELFRYTYSKLPAPSWAGWDASCLSQS